MSSTTEAELLIHSGNASQNNQLLQNCRIVVALASGCVSGILGLTSEFKPV